MSSPSVQLPAEVWTHVFGFLSAPDRLNARASCKYFHKLMDNRTLWKDYMLELTFPNGSYNKRFWSTVRRWSVSSAVVRSFQPKHWSKLVTELPDLATIVVSNICGGALDCLKHFTNLTRLYFRGCTTPFPLDTLRTVSTRLTHLSFCGTQFSETSFDAFVLAVSQFTSLVSLVLHKVKLREYPARVIHGIVAALPGLTHLSVSVTYHYSPGHRPRLEPLRSASLSSLEIVNYEADLLPEHLMKLLPSVRSLAVFFESHPEEETYLATWIKDLPHLSTLVVAKGPTLSEYVHSIPSTVTNIALSPAFTFDVRSSLLLSLLEQVPHLRHLHLDLSRDEERQTRCIPYTFHKLQTLKIFCEHVPEKDFLSLVRLRELRRLELLDSVPPPSALIQTFKQLSKNRVKICKRQSDVTRCPCVSDVF